MSFCYSSAIPQILISHETYLGKCDDISSLNDSNNPPHFPILSIVYRIDRVSVIARHYKIRYLRYLMQVVQLLQYHQRRLRSRLADKLWARRTERTDIRLFTNSTPDHAGLDKLKSDAPPPPPPPGPGNEVDCGQGEDDRSRAVEGA